MVLISCQWSESCGGSDAVSHVGAMCVPPMNMRCGISYIPSFALATGLSASSSSATVCRFAASKMPEDGAHVQFKGSDTVERINTRDNVRRSSTYRRKSHIRDSDVESISTSKDASVRDIDYKQKQVC